MLQFLESCAVQRNASQYYGSHRHNGTQLYFGAFTQHIPHMISVQAMEESCYRKT